MHEKECSLNLGAYVVRVEEKLLSIDLPNLCSKSLGASVFLSCERYVPALKVYVGTSAFWFEVVFNCF